MWGGTVLAQDPQFSQYYAAPLYHNPAFAGGAGRDRFVLNYRNQWPSIPGAFVTYAFSYDHYARKYNSGFGISATTDKAGSGNLRSSSLGAAYAYQLALNRVWMVRAGLQFGYAFRNIDYFRLTFGDQVDPRGFAQRPTNDMTQFNIENIGYFDVSSGFLLYSRQFWFGMGAHHMNEPNQSLVESNSGLPMRMTFTAGTVIPLQSRVIRSRNIRKGLEPDKSLTPSVLYKFQGEFDQMDIGCYIYYKPLAVGFWYRGLPVKNYRQGLYNHDAVVLLLGVKQPNYRIGYSYDLTISGLGANTGGAHEISLTYEFDTKVKLKKKPKLIPCPKF
ncbi:type IX secretion system membrane protein, PorP/SprF family [Catalinimonas alkaloidigena]|uniref:Type IX secretion system membrane protein, PorP/SprF family n=2 Tax=Catalinimonas alkaloidigena TaxID=1075417 RepID=A0A1G8WNY3_9BACT|nr:type IX secretion system membrane protein, PorP/SprF family [Catalinimonas alkaloidigena]